VLNFRARPPAFLLSLPPHHFNLGDKAVRRAQARALGSVALDGRRKRFVSFPPHPSSLVHSPRPRPGAGGDNIYFGPPSDYLEPSWPGLYPPFATPNYLYTPYSIWRFTVFWTILLFGLVFLFASLLSLPSFFRRHHRLSLLLPLVFVGVGVLGAFVSGTIVGYALAALYNSTFLRMSTFVPALYGAVQTLILIAGAYTLKGV